MKSFILVCMSVILFCGIDGAPLPNTEDGDVGSFWFGTQDLECLKGKGLARDKRSLETPERQTLQYIHRLVYYRGYVFEWGNGGRGFHLGNGPAVPECHVTWEEAPAGNSPCPRGVIEQFTQTYRAKYGGYNLILNNCHHFANRVSIILTSSSCNIPNNDRWSEFSDEMWSVIRGFVSVFKRGTIDRPQDIERASSRDPNVHHDWPIVQWY